MKGLRLLCKQGRCPRTFCSFDAYIKHVVRQHMQQQLSQNSDVSVNQPKSNLPVSDESAEPDTDLIPKYVAALHVTSRFRNPFLWRTNPPARG